MKILHVVDFSLPHRQSGYSIRSKYIVETQAALGETPVVLTRYGGPTQPSGIDMIQGIPYFRDRYGTLDVRVSERLAGTQRFDTAKLLLCGHERRFLTRIEQVVQAEGIQVIHVATPANNALAAVEAGHRLQLPVVYEVRGLWHESAVAQGVLHAHSVAYDAQQEAHLKALEQADAVVTLSETLREDCLVSGVSGEKIFVVPNAVDLAKCQEKPGILAKNLGIEDHDMVLGYIGLVRSIEGLDLLLKAGKHLIDSGRQLKLLIVGGGNALPNLKMQSTALGLDEKTIFTGEVPHDQVGAYYSLLDVFVIPRTRSRVTDLVTPLKPYEAMGMGKALIVSDVAALKEVVTDGKTGRICKADDVDDLVRVCGELIDHAEKRNQLGQQAYDWVKQNRTWEKVVMRYRDVYEYAIKKKDICHVASMPKRKKQIVFYSQHLVGVGHHFRNRQIVRALSEVYEVTVFDGGRSIPGAEWPDGVRLVRLPALCAGRNGSVSDDQSMMSAQVMKKRQMLMADFLKRMPVDVFVIEFFPFCRWSLRPEILSAMDAAKRANPNVKILCSLRDIPTRAATQNLQLPVWVPRKAGDEIRFYSVPFGGIHHEQVAFSRRYYEEVCPTLNAFFDAVLVHGDPLLSRLEDHFLWVEDIAIPIVYTGFVSEPLWDVVRPEGAPDGYVLVSAGGGAEGYDIARPCIEAWKRLCDAHVVGDRVMVIFAGAFINEAHFSALQGLCGDGPFRIERFSSEFLKWVHGADLSISRAGYNTCMNVLETHTRAILLPSIAMDDQEFRAQKFAELGLAEVVHPDGLSANRMADAILRGLGASVAEHRLNLDGAKQTRKFVESL